MSTYWGYACVSHEPSLVSEHWFNHGEDLLREAYDLERRGLWPDVPVIVGVNDALAPEPQPVEGHDGHYPTAAPIYWLRSHPHCIIVLHNEYWETELLGDTVSGSITRALT